MLNLYPDIRNKLINKVILLIIVNHVTEYKLDSWEFKVKFSVTYIKQVICFDCQIFELGQEMSTRIVSLNCL